MGAETGERVCACLCDERVCCCDLVLTKGCCATTSVPTAGCSAMTLVLTRANGVTRRSKRSSDARLTRRA
eukprot:3019099-Rhodomonas_salina.1